MVVRSMEEAKEEIPHDEYYFYVADHENESRLLHLTEDIVSDMRELVAMEFPSQHDSCLRRFKFRLDDVVWFEFKPDRVDGVFWHHATFSEKKRMFGSVFKDKVWFDCGFLCESTGPPADKHQHHYKEIREEVVLEEHLGQYEEELFEWEEGGGWDTDWMDW